MAIPAINEEEEEQRSSLYAWQLASSSVLPMVLKAAVELGVLEVIAAAGPGSMLSASQISSELKSTNPRAAYVLDQMLCLLAAHSVLTCSVSPSECSTRAGQSQTSERLYGLSPVSKCFIRDQEGGSLSPLLHLIQDRTMLDMWFHLKDAVLQGGLPFERASGTSAASYMGRDPRLSEIFRGSMKDFNKLFVIKMVETYNGFEGLSTLVDVGGGDGSILNTIISKYPSIKGINFDLTSTIERSPTYQGIENVAGDMFQSIPKGDAIFMKWMLHNWSDEDCVKILKNCYVALPVNGKVIVVELVIPEVPDPGSASRSLFQMHMFMMNLNPGGKERTEKEFDILAKEAGFSGVRVVSCAYDFSFVEIYKDEKSC
ncbi:hypothetical protein CRG98_004595 [Punica granatum]|nr:hypothetical protein CRG98_004595 [Punica granatum]